MRGQASIEFISLLAIALVASAILVGELNQKAISYSRSTSYQEAQRIAQKVSYSFDYVKTGENSSLVLDFQPGLRNRYNISVGEGQTVVRFDSGSASFPTRYYESTIGLNSSENYVIRYDGNFSVTS